MELKTGDKLYCIKNYKYKKAIDRPEGYWKRYFFLCEKEFSDLTEDEKSEFLNYDLARTTQEKLVQFIKGKEYKVTSKLGPEINIKGEEYTLTVSTESNDHFKTIDFLNKHFVDKIQYRKMKLEKLSDINFSNFLKNLKK